MEVLLEIVINGFEYSLDSMYTLAHEMGHVYDGFRIFDDKDSERYLYYNYRSVYLEVIPRIFERLLVTTTAEACAPAVVVIM